MPGLPRPVGLAPLLLALPGLCVAAPPAHCAHRHGAHGAPQAVTPVAIRAAVTPWVDLDAARSYPAHWRPMGDDRMPTMVSYGLGPDGLAASFGYRAAKQSRPIDSQPLVPSDERPSGDGGLLGATLSYRFR